MLLGNNEVGFALGSYDPRLSMVIDPVLSYSTYLGGSLGDIATGVAVNAAGDTYITGETGSSDFPISSGAYQTKIDGGNTSTDVFVTELNPQGQLVYSTFIGGACRRPRHRHRHQRQRRRLRLRLFRVEGLPHDRRRHSGQLRRRL